MPDERKRLYLFEAIELRAEYNAILTGRKSIEAAKPGSNKAPSVLEQHSISAPRLQLFSESM